LSTINGICAICGTFGKLSKEHIPPKKAYNESYFYQLSLAKYLKHQDSVLDFKSPNIQKELKRKQGGIKFNTLCIQCNNDTGSWYADSYIDWVNQGMSILLRSNKQPSLFYPTYIYPLRIIKQIVAMFFSVNAYDLQAQDHELVKFLKNKEERFLPHKYRIYTYYNIEGPHRFIRFSAVGSLTTSQIDYFSEIAYPPLGFVMTINSPSPDNRLTDITHFASYRYNDWIDHIQRFATLPTYLPIAPGDYRSKSEIQDAIDDSVKYRSIGS
jgi:hypothetical protein